MSFQIFLYFGPVALYMLNKLFEFEFESAKSEFSSFLTMFSIASPPWVVKHWILCEWFYPELLILEFDYS